MKNLISTALSMLAVRIAVALSKPTAFLPTSEVLRSLADQCYPLLSILGEFLSESGGQPGTNRTICCSLPILDECIQVHCSSANKTTDQSPALSSWLSLICSVSYEHWEQVKSFACNITVPSLDCENDYDEVTSPGLIRIARDLEMTTDPMIGYIMPTWLIILLALTIVGGLVFVSYVFVLLCTDKKNQEEKENKKKSIKSKKLKKKDSTKGGGSTYT